MSTSDRDALRDEIIGFPIGSGYYQASISIDEACDLADVILTSDWLAADRDRAWAEGPARALWDFRRLVVRCYPKGLCSTRTVVSDLDERIARAVVLRNGSTP